MSMGKPAIVKIAAMDERAMMDVAARVAAAIGYKLDRHPLRSTVEEKVVLSSFGYKSSYAGISDFRKYEAVREAGISQEAYEAAREELKRKGLIRMNNSLSPEGKNAREQVPQLFVLRRKSAMSRVSRIAEKVVRLIKAGTWSSPNSATKVSKLVTYWKAMKRGQWPRGVEEQADDFLYDLIGDDDLFDNLYELWKEYREDRDAKSYLMGVAIYVEAKISEWVKEGPGNWPHKADYNFVVDVARRMGKRVSSLG